MNKEEETMNKEEETNNLQKKAIYNMIRLINIAQNRGAFNLEEASQLCSSTKHFDKENKNNINQEQQRDSIILFIESLNKAQSKGILQIEEAHLAWECFQSFTQKDI